jgi:hypothetical protein
LAAGGVDAFAGLGSLREASGRTALDNVAQPPSTQGPVIGRAAAVPTLPAAPPLSTIPRNKRADFLADLYLAVHPRGRKSEDPIAEDARLAMLADAAAEIAGSWDTLVALETSDEKRVTRLVSAVDTRLSGGDVLAQGGFTDWMEKAGETMRRAAAWPGDAISTVFAELRPVLNEFVAYFIGDVLAYVSERDVNGQPGVIPRRVLDALRAAHQRKQATGEKIVVVTHSMGGQLLYDALAHYASADPTLAGLSVDHWISCGAQVSFFAELVLFRGQPTNVAAPDKLPRPQAVKAWTNFYDRNDLVGFVMAPVFEGVADIEYNTGYGLAFAHTGFLARPSFFEAAATRL